MTTLLHERDVSDELAPIFAPADTMTAPGETLTGHQATGETLTRHQATRRVLGPREGTRGARWFRIGMHLFGAAILISLAVVALGGVLPVRLLGCVSLAAAALGFGLCALGLRVCNPAQWRAGVHGWQWKLGMRELPPRREPRERARPVNKRNAWPATV